MQVTTATTARRLILLAFLFGVVIVGALEGIRQAIVASRLPDAAKYSAGDADGLTTLDSATRAAVNRVHMQVCDKEALNCLTLNALYPKIDERFGYCRDESCLAKEEAEIAKIKAWSSKLPDPCVVLSYGYWLDYYSGAVRGRREEIRKEKEFAASGALARAEQEEKMREIHCETYKRTHPPIPAPPD